MAATRRHLAVEVEVTTLAEAYEALDCQVEWIMLDTMSTDVIRSVVEQRDASGSGCRLEASRHHQSRDCRRHRRQRSRRLVRRRADALGTGARHQPLSSPFEPQEQTVRP